MKGEGTDDARLVIGTAAAVVAVLISQRLSSLVAGAAGPSVDRSLIAICGSTVLLSTIAPAVLRVRCTRTALRERVAFVAVPADEYDPNPETVMRFAAQLGRIDRLVRGWFDRRAGAVRFRLDTDTEGRLVYLIEGPAWSRDLLRSAIRSFDGVELRDPETVRAAAVTGEKGPAAETEPTVLRAELVMARPSVEPLAALGLDPDPLQPVAAAMEVMSTEAGDRATVCIDLLPAATLRRARLRRRLRREGRRRHRTRAALDELLGRTGRGRGERSEPVELAGRRAETRAFDGKLNDRSPLFEAQVLVRVEAGERSRAKAAMRGLLASFEPLASERNWLRVSGLPILGLGFLGSDLPGRRRSFDRRFRSGLFRPTRTGIVSARELVGWLKPPTVRCLSANVLRSGALVSPPPPLPDFKAEAGLIPVGRIATEEGERVVGVPTADTFFSYIVGRSRYGKTELAIAQFVHLVRAGEGGMFIDPHADALARIKPYLAEEGVRERVIEINLAESMADRRQPGWNVLGVGDPAGVEAVADAFASAMRWDERNSRALNLTTQAAQALGAVARELPDELAPTIFQLPTLLSDENWREAVLPLLPRAARRFWTDRFPKLSSEAITPVTNLVDRLRSSPPCVALLGQSRGTFDLREVMDRKAIVLFSPGSGGIRARTSANLMFFALLRAAKSRAGLAVADRSPFWVYGDEAQTYDGGAGGNVAGLIEQAAKYGLRLALANQNPERLSAETFNAISTNASHTWATALNSPGAAVMAKEWGGRPAPAALTGLPRFRFLAQVTHGGETSRPFAVGGLQAEELFGAGGDADRVAELDAAIEENGGGRSPTEVIAELDHLDDRIYHALGGAGESAASSDGTFPIGSGGSS
ncbi:MAG: hypothetical protein JSS68_09705 [Actinobacteria bacterium]|nr:hypothetical protein [Actinomycetota bacterium]